jgi:membrane fusion protein
MHNVKLFRTAALNARQSSFLGDIILIRPVSFSLITVIAAVFAEARGQALHFTHSN